VEVAVDHLLEAGDLVEFEFNGDVTARLESFIASLDVELGQPINRGYPRILLNQLTRRMPRQATARPR
jgi:adenylate cyclase class 2